MTRTEIRLLAAMAVVLLSVGAALGLGAPIALALAAGLAVAAPLSLLLGAALRKPLVELRDGMKALREGHGERRPRPDSTSELGAIAAAIDRDAAALRDELDAAAAEKHHLEAVLAAMVEGVLVLGPDGRILLINPRLRELLDVWNDLAGRRPLELVRNTEIDAALIEASVSDTVVVHELVRVGPEQRTLLMHAARVEGVGIRSGTVAVFHDVSEIRHLEGMRRDFMANASHELRTPLTSIRGYAETVLAGSSADRDQKSALQAILRNAHRLGALIDDLLELSRIEGRKSPLRPSELDVAKLCAQLADDASARLREARIEIQVETAGDAVAWADQSAVEQVVGNLLDNAIKYTEPGGKITLGVQRISRGIEVRVDDTGVGIPAVEQSRIFERFYRVDKARSRALGGTGLGLSIVKHLVQAMGGDVRVESESGTGSSFRFYLPLAAPDPS